VAVALAVGTVGLLLATPQIGFNRDESFYFEYARSYQDWLVGVEQAERPAERREALGRKTTIATWSGNFEHPPLMKLAFGLAWRCFGRKDRRVQLLHAPGEETPVASVSLGPPDGFAEGAEVWLLTPLLEGQAPADPDRDFARGVVIDRQPRKATVRFDGVEPKELEAACAVKAGDEVSDQTEGAHRRAISGCMVREDRALAVLSESAALRLPGAVSGGLAVMLTFLLGVELFGGMAGFLGALMFLFVPRHFYHAHLACFDMPVVAATLATLYAFWRARDDRRWALGTAVLWGVALGVKHNAFFLPFPLLLFWLWCGRGMAISRHGWRLAVQLPPLPMALLVMPVVAFPMLFVVWPRLWYDPFLAVEQYFSFHLDHVHYMVEYFGVPMQVPPFPVAYPFVLTLMTVPEVFSFLMGVGFLAAAPLRGARRWLQHVVRREPPSEREQALVYVLLNGLIPIFIIAMPSVPIFGGVKHWMAGMPWLCLLAGFGLTWALGRVGALIAAPAARAAVLALVSAGILLHPALSSVHYAGFGTGYYNSLLAGGLQGAADKGMMRLYWGHNGLQTFAWLNHAAPPGARVYFQDTTPGSYDAYQRDGTLRHDLRYMHQARGADIALIECQRSFADRERDAREATGSEAPLWTASADGVPFVRVYAKPELGLKPP
jgi:hypothetical protein